MAIALEHLQSLVFVAGPGYHSPTDMEEQLYLLPTHDEIPWVNVYWGEQWAKNFEIHVPCPQSVSVSGSRDFEMEVESFG